MSRINLDHVILGAGLDRIQVAKQLYPDVLHPMQSMSRVIRGESKLDEEQIFKLAALVGCDVSDLYVFDHWKVASQDKIHVFSKGDWDAILDTTTNITRIYNNSSIQYF